MSRRKASACIHRESAESKVVSYTNQLLLSVERGDERRDLGDGASAASESLSRALGTVQ